MGVVGALRNIINPLRAIRTLCNKWKIFVFDFVTTLTTGHIKRFTIDYFPTDESNRMMEIIVRQWAIYPYSISLQLLHECGKKRLRSKAHEPLFIYVLFTPEEFMATKGTRKKETTTRAKHQLNACSKVDQQHTLFEWFSIQFVFIGNSLWNRKAPIGNRQYVHCTLSIHSRQRGRKKEGERLKMQTNTRHQNVPHTHTITTPIHQ